jgi:XTP/dITP diphosphohydrolase
MKKLLIATKNPGKFSEISEVLGDGDFELVFLGDLDVEDSDFLEDGETFAENAEKKARYYADKLGMMALGEDSGLLVDALEGELGVKTRRWGAGEEASDEEWLEFFMNRMEEIVDEERGAKFVCCSCLIGLDGEVVFFDAESPGTITRELMADLIPGLPLSSVFIPEGCGKAYAALEAQEKNKLSHRGKALRKVGEYLTNL